MTNKSTNEKTLTALIVDDERLARTELISMLKPFGNIRVVGEADSVDTAIRQVEKHNPDLIFLDIQMPGRSGFDLLDQISTEAKIVFVTAYDEYAIRAFEVNAIDYLPKPVSEERLAKTVERVIVSHGQVMPSLPLKKLKHTDRLFLEFGRQVRFIKISEIILISAEGDYSAVILASPNQAGDKTKGMVSKSLKEWEDRLPEDTFCRIHRSSIINTEYIERIDKYYNNSFKVKLKGINDPLIISRRYAKKIKGSFG